MEHLTRKSHSSLVIKQKSVSLAQSKDIKLCRTHISHHLFSPTSTQMMLLINYTKYSMSQSIKDIIKYFIEVELNGSLASKQCMHMDFRTLYTGTYIDKIMDKGSIMILCQMKDGSILGAFSYIGLISGINYVTDSQICGIILKDGSVFVFELGNKMLSYSPPIISFGRFGVDFTLNLASMEENAIFTKTDILPMGIKSISDNKIENLKIYTNFMHYPL